MRKVFIPCCLTQFIILPILLRAIVSHSFLVTYATPRSSFLVPDLEYQGQLCGSTRCGTLFAKRKESMAEKRARRQGKQQQQAQAPPSLRDTAMTTSVTKDTQSQGVVQTHKDEVEFVKTKAQQLLARQKESISVLTSVREAVEQIEGGILCQSLQEKGYYVVNDFLNDGSLLESMQREAAAVYDSNITYLDTEAIGFSGEFLTPLQGGEEQYKIAPRSIEWVVGVTKYMPSRVEEIDSGNCMAFMRTFDRSSRQAARQLFLGEQQENDDNVDDEDEPTASAFAVEAPEEEDMRYLSLRYYLVSKDWDSAAAGSGGLRFESLGKTIEAKSNRLIIYKSKEASLQKDAWYKGNQARANCIELHLLKAMS
mmetsp:Transcript_18449/g.23752  ORF Transcript_18449/g.23752 Transcript_18449/m.23752 type:complete len:368 (-) Transcript_18449:185-1288(-)